MENLIGSLKKSFIYDPDTGEIFKRIYFGDGLSMRGRRAFVTLNQKGYMYGFYFKKTYAAHRVAWALYHGHWPINQIDHIDGDRTDNRISNLREVVNQENSKNLGMRPTNKSGVNGVHWFKQSRKWMAKIKHKGKTIYLGTFNDLSEAAKARAEAEVALGFHPNHGKRPATKKSTQNYVMLGSEKIRPVDPCEPSLASPMT